MADPKIDRPSWLGKTPPSAADTAPVRVNIDLASLPHTRAQAKALGVNRYYTGKPCKNGHLCERRTSSRHCVKCFRVAKKRCDDARFVRNPVGMRKRYAAYSRAYLVRRRQKLLEILCGGVPQCAKCGCDDTRVLEINHIDGGGGKEIQKMDSKNRKGVMAQGFYMSIIKNERKTDDLNVLCRPCNALHYLNLKYGFVPLSVKFLKPEAGLLSNIG